MESCAGDSPEDHDGSCLTETKGREGKGKGRAAELCLSTGVS